MRDEKKPGAFIKVPDLYRRILSMAIGTKIVSIDV